MTANMSTSLYGRISDGTGIPQHAIKKVLYFLAYNGEMAQMQTGSEEFELRAGVSFADRSIAIVDLASWMQRWSRMVDQEAPPVQYQVAVELARQVVEGGSAAVALRKDHASLTREVYELRAFLDDVRTRITEVLDVGGA